MEPILFVYMATSFLNAVAATEPIISNSGCSACPANAEGPTQLAPNTIKTNACLLTNAPLASIAFVQIKKVLLNFREYRP